MAEKLSAEILPSGSLRLKSAGDVTQLDEFESGTWWVQDASAALPAKLLGDDLSGQHIVDLCAAPGGKTAQIAAAGATVTAVDRSANRLKRLDIIKSGGMLIYCTCSLQKKEGEDQVQKFLDKNPNFQTVPVKPEEVGSLENVITPEGWLRVLPTNLPDQGGMDGFFAARLKKV